jgi:phosphoserine phosphatase RsbU/P
VNLVEDLYENAPCGYLAAFPDGRIAKVNTTLSDWLGYGPDTLLGRRFADLLTAGGRIHYETHFAPLLHLSGRCSGITVDLVTADGTRLPMFLTANVSTDAGGRPDLLRITVQDAGDRRSYERELLEAQQQAERERARVEVLATTLRRSLLPPSLSPPDGLDAAAYYHAASTDEVGGDFYDLFPLTSEKWGFFLGDVCGKGAGAAAVTSLTRYTLRAAAVYDDDPVAVLHNLDTVLSHEFHGDDPRFCTVIFGVLTVLADGFDVVLASGGHPPALLLGADGDARYLHTEGGQVVGMLPDVQFVSTRIRLGAGDTLVLYTDGLTEARTGVGNRRYDDDDALVEFARSHAPTTAAAITAAIRSLLDGFGAGLQDDAAILALSVPTRPASSSPADTARD